MISRATIACCMIAAVLVGGCGDDETPTNPGRAPQSFDIPTDISLEEAGEMAVAGDTLVILSGFPLDLVTETITFSSAQTPLLITGDKGRPVIAASGMITVLQFIAPNPGSLIKEIGFSGGTTAVEVLGGTLTVERCSFNNSIIQVLGAGAGTAVVVTGCLMRDAGLYSVALQDEASGIVTSNTIDSAGDCGVFLFENAVATVSKCIINGSAQFGIACRLGATLSAGSGCNDIFGSGASPYSDCTDGEGSFSLDPLFCGGGDFSPDRISPCSPENSGGCDLIGALETVDCNP